MESDWYSTSAAAFVDAYNVRVGAGITAARDEMRSIEGERDVAWSNGI